MTPDEIEYFTDPKNFKEIIKDINGKNYEIFRKASRMGR